MVDPESPGDSREDEPGMPRWVKAGVIITVVIVLVLVIGKATGIEHGAGQHSSDDSKAKTADSSDAGHKPPVGGHG